MTVTADESIIVVSGLPRSGTSLMMQVLRAGGVPVLADAHRPADISNPRGYLEYEKVKRLAADNSWLGEARGKAVKVIAQLVPFLPRGLRYQVLFMRRDLGEVIGSQTAMIQSLGRSAAGDFRTLAPVFERNLATARQFFQDQPSATVESFEYLELVTAPAAAVARITQFLGRPDLDRRAMIEAIEPSLYRSRSGDTAP